MLNTGELVGRGVCLSLALALGGCSCAGYTGEAGDRWYGWQREEAALDRSLWAGECTGPTEIALRLWREAMAPDAPEGTISIWIAGGIFHKVAEQCPTGALEFERERARLEARLLAGDATEAEMDGWWRLSRLAGDGASAVRVVEAGREDASLRRLLRDPEYRREDIQAAVREAGRADLASVIAPGRVQAVGEGIGDGLFTAAGYIIGPILGPLIAPR